MSSSSTSTRDIILLWIGVAGFIISILNVIWNIVHYSRRLHTWIRSIRAFHLVTNKYLVLFDVRFWNRSSQIRSVENWNLVGDHRISYLWRIERVDYQDDPADKEKLLLVDSLGENVWEPQFRERTFVPSLDIKPHQSGSKWIPILLTFADVDMSQLFLDKPWKLGLCAIDPKGKGISKCIRYITVRELTSN